MWLVEVALKMACDPSDDLRSFINDAYAELCKLEGVVDPDWSATLSEKRLSFFMLVPGEHDDRHAPLDVALGAVRTALHTAGAHTTGWDERVDELLSRSRVTSEPVFADTEPIFADT